MLGLQYLAPSGFLCFVFLEGAIALGILLALAELVSWWGVLVLPVTVAVMVKLNDVVAGALTRASRAASTGSARRGAGSDAWRSPLSGRGADKLGAVGAGSRGRSAGLGDAGLDDIGLADAGLGDIGFGAEPADAGLGAEPARARFGAGVVHAEPGVELVHTELGAELVHTERGAELGHAERGAELVHTERGAELGHAERGAELVHNERGAEFVHNERGAELGHAERGLELIGEAGLAVRDEDGAGGSGIYTSSRGKRQDGGLTRRKAASVSSDAATQRLSRRRSPGVQTVRLPPSVIAQAARDAGHDQSAYGPFTAEPAHTEPDTDRSGRELDRFSLGHQRGVVPEQHEIDPLSEDRRHFSPEFHAFAPPEAAAELGREESHYPSKSFASEPDRFSTAPERFTPTADPFPAAPERFTRTADPFPATPEQFTPTADHSPATTEPFAPTADPLPATPEPFEPTADPLPAASEQFTPAADRFSPASGPFSPASDPYPAASDPFSPEPYPRRPGYRNRSATGPGTTPADATDLRPPADRNRWATRDEDYPPPHLR
jgi:hypothetical protein